MKPGRAWQDMSSADFQDLPLDRLIAILPVAAVEQHGPHLPLSVDARLNAGLLQRTMNLIPDTLPVTVLPAQTIGKSTEHRDFPGTLTCSAGVLIRQWTEIADSVVRAGLRKLILFNSHGGQPQIADIVAQDMRSRHGILAATVNWYDLGLPAGLPFDAGELRLGIHGGAVETSMMLHLHPELVRMDKAADFPSRPGALTAGNTILGPRVSFAWQAQDLHASGAVGNPTLARAAAGQAIVDHVAAALARLLEETDAVPNSFFRAGPLPPSHN